MIGLSRRAAFGALALPLALPAWGAEADPVLAAIEAACAAEEAFRAALADITDGDDAGQSAAADAAGYASDDALEALMRTRPTTFAGLCSLVRYLGDEATRNHADDGGETLLRLAELLSRGPALP